MNNTKENFVLNPNLAHLSFTEKENPPENFTGAHVVLLNQKQEIILVKELISTDPYPNLPGGGREFQETAQETAARECDEELGLKIDSNDLIFLGNLYLGDIIFPLFLLQNQNRDTLNREGFEIQAYKWTTFLGMVSQLNATLALRIGEAVNKKQP